ncbi:hypothetical protein H0H92_003472 [Tricholoma furcatifolium]|nr:hypothetical protein H0H92_003472 [Tricholoma furcatifolium]
MAGWDERQIVIGKKTSWSHPRPILTRQEVFGYSAYRGQQKEIIEAAARGDDVLVVAPTGMGKALIFAEVDSLREKSIPVVYLSSETPPQEKEEVTSGGSSSSDF